MLRSDGRQQRGEVRPQRRVHTPGCASCCILCPACSFCGKQVLPCTAMPSRRRPRMPSPALLAQELSPTARWPALEALQLAHLGRSRAAVLQASRALYHARRGLTCRSCVQAAWCPGCRRTTSSSAPATARSTTTRARSCAAPPPWCVLCCPLSLLSTRCIELEASRLLVGGA